MVNGERGVPSKTSFPIQDKQVQLWLWGFLLSSLTKEGTCEWPCTWRSILTSLLLLAGCANMRCGRTALPISGWSGVHLPGWRAASGAILNCVTCLIQPFSLLTCISAFPEDDTELEQGARDLFSFSQMSVCLLWAEAPIVPFFSAVLLTLLLLCYVWASLFHQVSRRAAGQQRARAAPWRQLAIFCLLLYPGAGFQVRSAITNLGSSAFPWKQKSSFSDGTVCLTACVGCESQWLSLHAWTSQQLSLHAWTSLGTPMGQEISLTVSAVSYENITQLIFSVFWTV